MNLRTLGKTHAFTIVEMMFATAAASAIVAVTLTSSVALQKTLSQIDNCLLLIVHCRVNMWTANASELFTPAYEHLPILRLVS